MNRFKIPSLLLILILTSSIALGQINWTENTLGVGLGYANHLYPVDLDQDGDMDVVITISGTPGTVAWFENNGSMNFTLNVINNAFDGAWTAFVGDIDNDNDLDIVSAASSDDEISWFENNGSQVFTEHVLVTGFSVPISVHAEDIDHDGDMDIFGAALIADEIRWWENNGSQVFTQHYVAQSYNGANSCLTVDMDGDNDFDVLACGSSGDMIAWFENDGNQNFTQRVIVPYYNGPQDAVAIDMDSDGDMDVVSAASYGDTISWFENDGNMNFTQHDIETGYEYPRTLCVTDIDQDTDFDIVTAAYDDSLITWFENDGSQNFTRHDIRSEYYRAMGVNAADMDLDGDMDILGVSFGRGSANWWASDLGPVSGIFLDLTPHNPPIQIPGSGGSFSMDALIQNLTTDPVNFDAWTMVVLPSGIPFGPLIERRGLVIPAGATIMRTLTQNVPLVAPAGNYTYQGYVMTLPDSITITDNFPFSKLAGDGAPNHNQGWACYGWDDEKSHITNHKSKITNLAVSPNPFNPTTDISFKLRAASNLKLAVYDVSGREVARLVDGFYPAGTHQVLWDASMMASGVYFARLEAGAEIMTEKLLLVK